MTTTPERPTTFEPVCTAPYLVMDFDPAGNVQACCVNAMYPLGNVGNSTIREIWEGERARTLRRAIERGDLGYGCGVCRHRLAFEAGDPASWYYNNYPAAEPDPEWPFLMAFALHNTCNAACIMCGGDLSSKIRSQREERAPLPHVYGDRFFAELEEFLPHLGIAEFRGGEPFLIPEHFRIFDSLIAMDHRIPCNVTTNGTILTSKVEAVMEELPFAFVVSIDGTTRETLEAVRVGVAFDKLMANIPRFLEYTRERETSFELSCCALQQNWHELADIFRFASDLDVPLAVQPVLDQRYGLHRLPTEDLKDVARQLGAETAALELVLGRQHLEGWQELLGRLDQELHQREQGDPLRIFEFPDAENLSHVGAVRTRASASHPVAEPAAPVAVAEPTMRPPWRHRLRRLRQQLTGTHQDHVDGAPTPTLDDLSRAELMQWAPSGITGFIRTDHLDVVTAADLSPLADVDAPRPDLSGLTFGDAISRVAELLGSLDSQVWIAEEAEREGRIDHTLFFGRSEFRDKTGVVVRVISSPDGQGGVASTFAVDPVMATDPGTMVGDSLAN